jgi:hypothetical protein
MRETGKSKAGVPVEPTTASKFTTLETERAELAAQQELLLASLLAKGEPPADIDEAQIMANASSLLRRRARCISRSFPVFANDQSYCGKIKEVVALIAQKIIDPKASS